MTIEELTKEIQKLSHADQAKLFRKFGLESPHLSATCEVRIDDALETDRSKERRRKNLSSPAEHKDPTATLIYPDGSEECIDIIASVSNNSTSIGHPLVLHAIRRWEEMVKLNQTYFKTNHRKESPCYKEIKHFFYGRFFEMAENNLRRIGQALLKGAKKRALSPEEALKLYVTSKLGTEPKNDLEEKNLLKDTRLYKAYLLLTENEEIKNTRRADFKLNKLREPISNLICNHISTAQITEFLNSDNHKALTFLRTWEDMRNAFIAWELSKDRATVKSYLSKAKKKEKQQPTTTINKQFLIPSINTQYGLNEIKTGMSLPTVPSIPRQRTMLTFP